MKPKQKAGEKEVMFVRLRFSEVQCEISFQKIALSPHPFFSIEGNM